MFASHGAMKPRLRFIKATAQESVRPAAALIGWAPVAVAPWFKVVLFLAAVMVGGTLIYKFLTP